MKYIICKTTRHSQKFAKKLIKCYEINTYSQKSIHYIGTKMTKCLYALVKKWSANNAVRNIISPSVVALTFSQTYVRKVPEVMTGGNFWVEREFSELSSPISYWLHVSRNFFKYIWWERCEFLTKCFLCSTYFL